jgi:hypothetical protein
MRKDEFIKAVSSYTRRATAAFLIPMLLAFACIIAYMPFQHRFEACLGSKFTGQMSDILAMAPMALPLLLALVVFIPLSRRIDLAMGVPCPHCGKPLAQFKAIVIASKNCPYCGRKVLEDTP